MTEPPASGGLGEPIVDPALALNSAALQPFDLSRFLAAAARTLRWQCPVTNVPTTVRHLSRDAYFGAVFSAAAAAGAAAVEVCYNGRWRPYGTSE